MMWGLLMDIEFTELSVEDRINILHNIIRNFEQAAIEKRATISLNSAACKLHTDNKRKLGLREVVRNHELELLDIVYGIPAIREHLKELEDSIGDKND